MRQWAVLGGLKKAQVSPRKGSADQDSGLVWQTFFKKLSADPKRHQKGITCSRFRFCLVFLGMSASSSFWVHNKTFPPKWFSEALGKWMRSQIFWKYISWPKNGSPDRDSGFVLAKNWKQLISFWVHNKTVPPKWVWEVLGKWMRTQFFSKYISWPKKGSPDQDSGFVLAKNCVYC